MSNVGQYYTPQITLIDKTQTSVVNIAIEGNGLKGNLNDYRISGKYPESSINKSRHGTITLRAPERIVHHERADTSR